ncbi:cell division protein DivIVA [Streptomyces sp. CC53]|uniref:DivIVA domain-containing protein n=1 Tax=unclassified Streptomyces TaxID=2593676 RepID=UPI0008DE7C3C|nr:MULTISPECIES: DivIVA domain-containing protein [unclassified Streptomyces]OII63927.1 cell division protein DivIVA [Streptomyces sp. CC53]
MFWFLAVAMVVVVAAVTVAVIGGGRSEPLPEAAPEHLVDPLPATRPVSRADVEALRLPMAVRGYRMVDVDDVLDRLAAELAERDARIAELEAALAGAQATAVGGDLFAKRPQQPPGTGDAGDREADERGGAPADDAAGEAGDAARGSGD